MGRRVCDEIKGRKKMWDIIGQWNKAKQWIKTWGEKIDKYIVMQVSWEMSATFFLFKMQKYLKVLIGVTEMNKWSLRKRFTFLLRMDYFLNENDFLLGGLPLYMICNKLFSIKRALLRANKTWFFLVLFRGFWW